MKAFRLLPVLLLCPLTLSAFIWRVDNDPGRAADFTSLQDAVNSENVEDGDTIYVAGSGANYGTVTITKRLFIYGPGFYLAQNLGETAELSPAIFTTITIGDGTGAGAGTLVSGITTTDLNIYASNVTVKRNRITRQLDLGSGSIIVTNPIIVQNIISGSTQFGGEGMIHSYNSANSGIIIMNNYIYNATQPADAISLTGNNDATVMYNFIENGDIHLVGSVFHLNIVTTPDAITISGGSVKYNVSTGSHGAGALSDPTNKNEVPLTNIILNSGTSDGRLALAVDSEAAGIGPNGEDAGIFGGDEPYVLSGVPALPTITEIDAPHFASPASGITISVKAKARN